MFLNFPSAVDGPQQEGSWSAALWETDEDDLLRPVRGRWGPERHQTSDREEPGVWRGFGSGLQRGGGPDSRRGWEEGDGVSMNTRPCFPFLRPTQSKRCMTLNSSQSFDWSVTLNPCHTALVETVSCYLLPHWSVSAKAHHLIGWKRRCFILLPHRMQSHEAEQGNPGQLVE